MTGRKPAGVGWQSWIDRQIEQGRARGDFDDLPGHGKPLAGVDRPRDELWWVRDKLRREGVEYLPPSLAIRRQAADAKQRAQAAPSEAEARRILEAINDEIRRLNRMSIEGPPTTLMAFDIDEVLAQRRQRCSAEAGDACEPGLPDVDVRAVRDRDSPRHRLLSRLRARFGRGQVGAGDAGDLGGDE